MPIIKPVSDLRDYNKVLQDVEYGEPVFLTKNGRGRFAIIDIEEYEKTDATIKLFAELAEGEKRGQKDGWRSADEVEAALGVFA